MSLKSVLNVKLLLGVVLLATALTAFACGDEEGPPAAPPSGATSVRVVLDEWSMTPSVSSVPTGRVTFEAVNQGAVAHEMVVLKTDLPPDALKMEPDGATADEEASGQNVTEVPDLDAGKTGKVTADLTPGKYVLVCNITGHYTLGMWAPFEVK